MHPRFKLPRHLANRVSGAVLVGPLLGSIALLPGPGPTRHLQRQRVLRNRSPICTMKSSAATI